jgi:N-acetylneuraminic acid mutarotase
MQAEGTVMMYDPASNTWRSVAAMPTARYGLTASTGPCGGSTARMCIYAAGGIGTSKATLATVQRYDPATNQWQTMPPLHSDLEQSVAVTGPCHGESTGKCIYVLGGTTGFQEDVLFSVETFQPSR